MSSDEKKENGGTDRITLSKKRFDSSSLHFTVLKPDTDAWRRMAAQLRCWNIHVPIVIAVNRCWQIGEGYSHYIVEEVDLYYHAQGEDKARHHKIRWRVFHYEGETSKTIVPPISLAEPTQPYAEITWSRDAVLTAEIRGLENLIFRGCSIAKESALLAQVVDALVIPYGWAFKPLVPFIEAKSKANNDNRDEKKMVAPSAEQLWLAQACPAAKAIGKRNGKLTIETLAEEMNVSDSTIKARKRSFPDSWPKVEAAHLEGKQEYATEQMAKTDK